MMISKPNLYRVLSLQSSLLYFITRHNSRRYVSRPVNFMSPHIITHSVCVIFNYTFTPLHRSSIIILSHPTSQTLLLLTLHGHHTSHNHSHLTLHHAITTVHHTCTTVHYRYTLLLTTHSLPLSTSHNHSNSLPSSLTHHTITTTHHSALQFTTNTPQNHSTSHHTTHSQPLSTPHNHSTSLAHHTITTAHHTFTTQSIIRLTIVTGP